ncbi:hypothetical protein GGR54DRAFT_492925 [Hypoxylon sp. NC1633]|nr:hypothetical protein GGR54DRAFT_492925 [Hypoxylon sp. NC1633]
MAIERTKEVVLLKLNNADYAFKGPVDLCKGMSFEGFPEAFSVISKHIKVLPDTLAYMAQYLSDDRMETQELQEMYTGVYELAENCRSKAEYIYESFNAFKNATDFASKQEQYRKVVSKYNGTLIEDVMKSLLKQALDIAVKPLVSDDLTDQLKNAQKEVDAVKPSLNNDFGRGMIMNNYDKGKQFFHGGIGDLNHVTDNGTQYTRPGNINHNYAPGTKPK